MYSSPDRRAAFDRDPAKDRVKREALAAWQRSQEAYAKQFAHRMRTLDQVSAAFADDPDREAILHAAGVARMGQGSTHTQQEVARRLVQNFPRALALLARGEMYVRTVEIMLRATRNASDAVQQEVGRRVTEQIREWDAADVSRRVAAVLPEVESELEGEAQRERHERAKANRGIWTFPVEDGMARIGVETDQVSAATFAAGFEEIDRAQAELDRRDGVRRTAGQRRADVLTELPARYLALCRALQSGSTDALLAEAAARNAAAARARAASALGDPGPVQDELGLGLPPAGPPRAWQLDPTELAVQLLRVPVGCTVRINVHTPVTTLLELDQRASRLDNTGHTYLPAFLARALLPTAELVRVMVDHETGIPLAVDPHVVPAPEQSVHLDSFANLHERQCGCPHQDGCAPPDRPRRTPPTPAQRAHRQRTKAILEQRRRLLAMATAYVSLEEAESRHDPSDVLRAFVVLRDQTSRGIGCNRSARRADLDHRKDFAKGGLTASWNLDAQGQRAHHSKDGGWVPSKDEATGVITWTSPLGLTFRRRPVWDRPPGIRPDARIPAPSSDPAPHVERDRDETDRPLWRPPSRRAPDADARETSPDPSTPPRAPWGGDEPPPF